MDPSRRAAADLNEYPLALVGLGKNRRSTRQHRENGLIGRRSRSKIDPRSTNESGTSVASDDLGFVENRIRDAASAVDEEERGTKTSFAYLAFRFFELDSSLLDLGCTPRSPGLGA